MTLKYDTKQKRLVALTDAYCRRFGKTTFTVDEVARWALANRLHPVPRRGDAQGICAMWELRLEQAVSA